MCRKRRWPPLGGRTWAVCFRPALWPKPAGGPLTAFERECDNAVTRYVSDAKRVPFGEETVIAYLYAKEAELTAIRTILASRRAGLDGAAIRERLRETYV